MQILEKYLNAVGELLPARQKQDILNELSANLQAEIEDRAAELGRPLTEDEVTEVLKRHGHPVAVAGRYAPAQYLIGPTLFPVYWHVLTRWTPVATLVWAIASAVLLATGPHTAADIRATLFRLPGFLFTVAASMTLAFAIIEFGMRTYHWPLREFQKWDLRDLPEPKPARGSRIATLCGLVFGALFTIWIALIPKYPYLILGPGAAYLANSPVRLAPIWHALYLLVVLFFAARTGLEATNLFRPSTRAYRASAEAILHAISMAGFAFFLAAGDLFVVVSGAEDAAYRFAAGLTQGLRVAAAVGLVVAIWETTEAVRRVVQDIRSRPAAPRRHLVL